MKVKLESSVFELEATELFTHLHRRLLAFTSWKEAHEAMAVMPGRRVLKQFAGQVADRAEHIDPDQHLGVARFVQLRAGHVQQRLGPPRLQFLNHPIVEIELRRGVLPRAWIVRHPAAGKNTNAFRSAFDDVCDGGAQRGTALWSRQRWQIHVREKRDDGNLASLNEVLQRRGEGCLLYTSPSPRD